jgi:eukaryotic-like serine/threonine-protein kinase
VLTYAACGLGPFGSGNEQAIMYRLVNEQPDLSIVPDRLRHLIGACLAKEPGLRPTTAQLLARLAESVPDVPLTTVSLTGDSGTARVSAAGASMGSLGLAGRETRMYMAGLPATGDRLAAVDPIANAQGVSGQTRGYPDDAAFLGEDARRPWDVESDGPESDGPESDAPASRPRAARRRTWPVVAVVGCVLAGAGVTMALTLSPSRPHPDPADLGRSARPTEASSSHDGPGTASPSMSTSRVPGSATRPASATPARTGTPRDTSSSAPAQTSGAPTRSSAPAPTRSSAPAPTRSSASASAQPSSTGTTTQPPSTAPSTPSPPRCVLICIG